MDFWTFITRTNRRHRPEWICWHAKSNQLRKKSVDSTWLVVSWSWPDGRLSIWRSLSHLDQFADNRPYHFQAEDETDQKSWVAVLINCKEKALTKTFQHTNPQISPSLIELQKTLIRYVELLPGNDQCCDCSSKNGTLRLAGHSNSASAHTSVAFQTLPGLV